MSFCESCRDVFSSPGILTVTAVYIYEVLIYFMQ